MSFQDDSVRPIKGDVVLSYTGLGVQANQFRRLKSGQIRCDYVVDLHGLTVASAKLVLHDALYRCRKDGVRSLRIIHGKGGYTTGSVLKGVVNGYLRQHAQVLCFCSAQPKDGGTGAVYCLLKRLYM